MKRKSYSSTTKLEALTELEKGSTREDVFKKYGIDSSMFTKWQKKLPKIKKTSFLKDMAIFLKARAPVYPELDACMLSCMGHSDARWAGSSDGG
jgi:transposase-like protein